MLDNKLIKKDDKDSEAYVFYMKMKGDYYRYQCEVIKAPDTVEEEGHNSECCPPFYYLGGCILYIAATFPIV